MNEVEKRPRIELMDWIAEDCFPCRIEKLEVTVESGDAKHLQRNREEATKIFFSPSPLLIRGFERCAHLVEATIEVCDRVVSGDRFLQRLVALHAIDVRDDHVNPSRDAAGEEDRQIDRERDVHKATAHEREHDLLSRVRCGLLPLCVEGKLMRQKGVHCGAKTIHPSFSDLLCNRRDDLAALASANRCDRVALK